jgi:P-type Cu2+ transporter
MDHGPHAHPQPPQPPRSDAAPPARHDDPAAPHHGPAAPHAGHGRHAGHSVAMFRDRFWLTLALTVPTVVWSDMIQHWFGYTAPVFPGSRLLPAVFGTVVYLYGGAPFLRGAVAELRSRLPGMMTLIALAITVAFGYSLAVTLGAPGMDLWWELATLVAIMLLGHWVEMRSISQAQGALKALARLLPDQAARVRADGSVEQVPVSALDDGDLLLIRPGAGIPADGEVREGRSAVNEAMITGESRPVDKQPGATVIAGTINGQGSLRIEVTRSGDRTALAGIMRLVEQAQHSRSRAQALADRAARWLTYAAIVAAVLTAIAWSLLGEPWNYTVERVVTVLVIACPHALGLAVPLVIAISTTLGVQHGLLVRDRRGLEEARKLDIVVFDKTGTLTLAEHRVVDIATVDGLAAGDVLRWAAAAERDSEHPVARALMDSAIERGLEVPAATGFAATAGQGVSAEVEGRRFDVGGPGLLRAHGIELPTALAEAARRAAEAGRSAITLVEDGHALALFAVADAVRPESHEAVRRLQAAGIEVAMLTGDAEAVARGVAAELGITTVLAEVLPQDKAAVIRRLQSGGKRVAMVGDGVNDAPALVSADVGIAIGAGTDVAVEAGDIVLVRSDPRDVPTIVALSRASYRKMVQNLWWAAGYNILAIPLAAGVFAPWGFVLAPAFGAVLMSVSTVVVAINAQLLRRARIGAAA